MQGIKWEGYLNILDSRVYNGRRQMVINPEQKKRGDRLKVKKTVFKYMYISEIQI